MAVASPFTPLPGELQIVVVCVCRYNCCWL